jgi:hypothetical protein
MTIGFGTLSRDHFPAITRPATIGRFFRHEHLLALLVSAWMIYSATVFLHFQALIPDEALFLSHAQAIGTAEAYLSPPRYGYGQLYWAVMSALGGSAAARVLALALMIATPVVLLTTVADARVRLAGFFLWLSFPIAFWSGKLIGPELWTLALSAAAVAAFHHRLFALAGLLCGLATGIKLTGLPVAVIVGGWLLLSPLVTVPRLAAFGLASVAGLFIAFPSIASNLPVPAETQPLDFAALWNMFVLDRWEWDGVFSGGILHFFLAAPVFLAVILGGLWRAPRLAVPFAGGIAVLVAMLGSSSSQYGWYGVALIPPALYLAVQALPLGALIAAVLVNAVLQMPLTAAMIRQKAEQHRALSEAGTASCLQAYLDGSRKTVLDVVEPGLPLRWPDRVRRVRYWGYATPETATADAALVMTRYLAADGASRDYLRDYRVVAVCPHSLVLEKS